ALVQVTRSDQFEL
ncbi:hypothetical protein D049_4558B, partial [Vibrio parahaemolyticus VPTS-2010]